MLQQIATIGMAAAMLTASIGGTVGEMPRQTDYTYSYYADAISAPAAYVFEDEFIAEKIGLEHFSALEDMDTDENGNLYLIDSESGRLICLNSDFKLIKIVSEFIYNGEKHTFSKPKGICYGRNGLIYVADTQNGRIVIFDASLNCKGFINAPDVEDAQYDYEYLPSKVEADSEGRVYVVSENQTQGIFRFDKSGKFMGYFGAAKVEPNLTEMFFRLFASQKQLKGMLKFIPTEYSNITLDNSNFIYGTVSSVDSYEILSDIQSRGASVNPVRRLNQKGVDILVTKGQHPPVGDLSFETSNETYEGASTFIDVAVYKDGIYSVLDSKRGRVFTYDDQGNLIYIFGGRGEEKGTLTTPTSIIYSGNKILITDKATGSIKRFAPTAYANLIIKGINLYQSGEYDAEEDIWREVLSMHSGCTIANSGLGRTLSNKGEYKEALNYFRLANDRENYSDALKSVIREYGKKVTPWLLPIAAVLIIALAIFGAYRKRHPKPQKTPKNTPAYRLWKQIKYAGYVSVHPFDGFWDLKSEKRGSTLSATVLLIATLVVNVLHIRFMPFLFNDKNFHENSALMSGITGVVVLVALFITSNWALTTLMDGKGNFKDIYIYTCYSLFPMIVLYPPIIGVSYFLYDGSAAFLSMLTTVVMIWVLFLIFAGTSVTHHYSAGKTVITLVLTVVGMLIILFLCLLTLTLVKQMFTFAEMLFKEIRMSL